MSDYNDKMIYQATLRTAEQNREKAKKSYEASNDDGAIRQYETAAEAYREVAKLAKRYKLASNERIKNFKERAKECQDNANFLKTGDVPADRFPKSAGRKKGGGVTTQKRRGGSNSADTEKEEDDNEMVAAVNALLHNSSITFGKIGGLLSTKNEIKYSLGVSLAKKADIRLESWKNWLFYGPPGTGKTLLAAATSNLLKSSGQETAAFFNVKVSSLMSKYFGESTRIISQLYESARHRSPAVVFLDEFESICGSRDGSDSGTEKRILSTILAELDGLAEKGRSDLFVLTIAATNRPWDLDPAVLSRFDKKILIPLPDEETRAAILNINVEGRGYQTDFGSSEALVELTEGLSGREIDRLVKETTNQMVMDVNSDIVSLVDEGLDHVRDYQIKSRPLTLKDFREAIQKVHPVTSPEEMEKYSSWKDSDDE
ncbi:MAG: ATP-binding protein [Planctomycetota bacterium]|nr:ATP-binding protein [Planctomycetota bacterium]